MMNKFFLLVAVIAFGLNACDEPSATTAGAIVVATDSVNDPVEESFKIYSLPAPMQVAESIRHSESNFLKDEMVPLNTITTTRINKALITGMYGVDVGYSLAFDNAQEGINYLEKLLRIADELKILRQMDPQVVERFRENISNIDSTTFILLSSFNLFQDYLRKNQDDETSLLIFSGSFIEGLHLALSHYKDQPSQDLVNLIGQQKIFLENLSELYQKHAPDSDIHGQLRQLKKLYDPIRITFISQNDNEQKFEDIQIESNQLTTIAVKVAEIRNHFLKKT